MQINSTLYHEKVSVYCALLSADTSGKVQTQISIAQLGRLNRKFPPILIIIEAKNAHFFVCKRTGFVYQELRDFVKMTLTRVIDFDSSRVIL